MEENSAEQCCRKSFGESLLDTAQRLVKNPRTAPKEVAEERMTICQGCNHFDKGPGKCKLCGCHMKLKTTFANMKCPANKWKEWTPNEN